MNLPNLHSVHISPLRVIRRARGFNGLERAEGGVDVSSKVADKQYHCDVTIIRTVQWWYMDLVVMEFRRERE